MFNALDLPQLLSGWAHLFITEIIDLYRKYLKFNYYYLSNVTIKISVWTSVSLAITHFHSYRYEINLKKSLIFLTDSPKYLNTLSAS
jgi:hypothetical protein